jgi:hypothetical protein
MDPIWQHLPIELIGVIASKILEDLDEYFSKHFVGGFLGGTISLIDFGMRMPLFKIDIVNKQIRAYTTLRLYIGEPIPMLIRIINKFKYMFNDNTYKAAVYIEHPLYNDLDVFRWILERICPIGVPEMIKSFIITGIISGGLRDYYFIYVDIFGRISKLEADNITMAYHKCTNIKPDERFILDDIAKC